MLAYMATALIGVRGIVTDGDTGLPLDATITVVGREDHEIYTDPDIGDYHRMLMPGTYQLVFDASGYTSETYTVTVNSGDATRLDVALGKAAEVSYPNGGEQLAADQQVYVTWTGDPAAQFTVQYTSDFGQTGTITDDFERTALGPDYTTVGSGNWFTTTGVSHGGSYAARAGDIGGRHVDVHDTHRRRGTAEFLVPCQLGERIRLLQLLHRRLSCRTPVRHGRLDVLLNHALGRSARAEVGVHQGRQRKRRRRYRLD